MLEFCCFIFPLILRKKKNVFQKLIGFSISFTVPRYPLERLWPTGRTEYFRQKLDHWRLFWTCIVQLAFILSWHFLFWERSQERFWQGDPIDIWNPDFLDPFQLSCRAACAVETGPVAMVDNVLTTDMGQVSILDLWACQQLLIKLVMWFLLAHLYILIGTAKSHSAHPPLFGEVPGSSVACGWSALRTMLVLTSLWSTLLVKVC